METIYVYTPMGHPEVGSPVMDFLSAAEIPFSHEEVAPGSPLSASVADWSDGLTDIYPLVRIGTKIRVNFFNPSTALLARLFPSGGVGEGDVPRLADLTMYTTTWCPDCWAMERYLKGKHIDIAKRNADAEHGALDRIMRWSGGRRTVPSFTWGTKVRMFHPGSAIMGKLLGVS